jgi:hypothetical protein
MNDESIKGTARNAAKEAGNRETRARRRGQGRAAKFPLAS